MKYKRTVVLALSALLIALGALLPGIVGSRQDAAHNGEIYFASISEVQLEFSQRDMTLKETIAILCGMRDSVEIPEELASLKRSSAVSYATAAVEAYWEAGIVFQDENSGTFSFEVLSCQPYLAYSSSQDNKTNIFWLISFGSKDRSQQMTLTVDDRTGTVCAVDCAYGDVILSEEDMNRVLYNFSNVYLEELGEEFYDFDINKIFTDAQSPQDKSYLASSIRWWADDYEYRTTFFVNPNGFYTYLAVETY